MMFAMAYRDSSGLPVEMHSTMKANTADEPAPWMAPPTSIFWVLRKTHGDAVPLAAPPTKMGFFIPLDGAHDKHLLGVEEDPRRRRPARCAANEDGVLHPCRGVLGDRGLPLQRGCVG